LDEHGKPDFENMRPSICLCSNEHLLRLDKGEEVELPSFNFEKGCREFRGEKLRLEPDSSCWSRASGLNPRLTQSGAARAQATDLYQRADAVEFDSNNASPQQTIPWCADGAR